MKRIILTVMVFIIICMSVVSAAELSDNLALGAAISYYDGGAGDTTLLNMLDGNMETCKAFSDKYSFFSIDLGAEYKIGKVVVKSNIPYADWNTKYNMNKCIISTAGGVDLFNDSSCIKTMEEPVYDEQTGIYTYTYNFEGLTTEKDRYVGFECIHWTDERNLKIYEIEVYEEEAPITEGNLAYGTATGNLINITDGYLDTYTQITGAGWNFITLNLGSLKNIDRVVVTSNIPQEGWNSWYNLNKCAISETEAIDFGGVASVVKGFETPVYNADTGLYTYTYSFRGLTSAAHQYIGFECYNAWDPAQAGNLKIYEIEVYEAPGTIAGKAQVMSQKSAADYLGHAPAMVADGDEDTYMGIPKSLTGWQLMSLKLDSKYLIEKVTILTNGAAADANQHNLTAIALANGGDATAAWDGTAVKSTGRTAENTADGKLLLTYDFSTTSEAYSYVGLELNNFGGAEVDNFKIYEINVKLQPEKDANDLALVRNGALLKARYGENTYLENNNPNVPKNLFDNDVTTGYTPLNQNWDNVSVQLAEERAVSYIKYITDSPISVIANGFDMQPYVSNELSEMNEITYGDGYVRLGIAVSETQLADGKYEIIFKMPEGYETSTWKYAGFVAHDITDKSAPLTSPVIYQMSVYPQYVKIYYVSPSGDDANDGQSVITPFKTIEKARDEIRKINGDMKGDIYVYLMGGMYETENMITFDDRDSGSRGYKIKYCAYGDETPVISGGKKVTGWEQSGSLWSAPFESGDIKYYRELYVNGRRAQKAATEKKVTALDWYDDPEYDVAGGETPAEKYDGVIVDSNILSADAVNPSDIELHWDISWTDNRCKVEELIDLGDGRTIIKMAQPGFYQTMALTPFPPAPQYPFLIENVKELLDTPGEFYYDSTEKRMYYYPHETEDMTTAEVYAPVTECLLDIRGRTPSAKVSDIAFEGITFAHAAWRLPSRMGKYGGQASRVVAQADQLLVPGNITVNYAKNIEFKNNTFTGMGAVALQLEQGADNCIIEGNLFEDIGESAITVGHYDHNYVNTSVQNLTFGKKWEADGNIWETDLKEAFKITQIAGDAEKITVKGANNADFSDAEILHECADAGCEHSVDCTRKYRYIRVEAEDEINDIKIFGYSPIYTNLSYGKTAYSSGGENAAEVNDDAVYYGSGWRSDSAESWWCVDLGQEYEIGKIEIEAIKGETQEYSHGFTVEAAGLADFSDSVIIAQHSDEAFDVDGTFYAEVNENKKFRYVRVRKSGTLYLGEVRVLGEEAVEHKDYLTELAEKKQAWYSEKPYEESYKYWGGSAASYASGENFWAVDLLEPYILSKLYISDAGADSYTLEGSNCVDFSEYEVLSEVNSGTGEYNLQSENAYRYVRIKTNDEAVKFSSFKIYGENIPVICKNNTISNNYITRAGAEYWGACGITAFYTENLKVTDNTLYDLPYTGISLGWGWTDYPDSRTSRNNFVARNYIEKVTQECCDGGAIYTLGNMRGTEICENYVKDSLQIYDIIAFDAGSAYLYVHDNVMENGVRNTGIGETHEHIYVQNNYATSTAKVTGGTDCVMEDLIVYSIKNPSQEVIEIIENAGEKNGAQYKTAGYIKRPFGREPYSNLKCLYTRFVPNNVSGTREYFVQPLLDFAKTQRRFMTENTGVVDKEITKLQLAYYIGGYTAEQLIDMSVNLRELVIGEDAEKVSMSSENGNLIIKNNTGEVISATLFLTEYDGNKLTDIAVEDIVIIPGEIIKKSAGNATAYVWDMKKGNIPLSLKEEMK